MRKTYRIFAGIIAVLVVLQAALMVYAISGLFTWIDEGATLDKSVIEGWSDEPPTWEGAIGHFLHTFVIGTFLIPLLGLILLLISFFAKVPRGVMLAAVIVVLIVIQYLAGFFAEPGAPMLGLVHGANAFILFVAALMAAKAAKQETAAQETHAAAV
ncbi:MAG: hypothetical protein ACR2FE_01240 [Aeromicrobium sp.]